MRQANNDDEEYFALDEGFLDKPTFELIKKWKTSNEKDRIKKFKSTTVTPEEASELKEMISIMRTDDIDYKEYKKAFHKFCTFIHTIDKGVILKTINLTKNKDDDNYTLYVEYADNTKKITLPDDCKLYHLTKVSGIKKLIPFFKGKNQKGYLYDKPRIYFTIRKKMPKFLADYKVNDKMYTYECIKDIKDVYVDPLVPSFIQGAVYIETPNPVPVEQVGMKAGSNDEDTVESKNEAYIEEMMEREEFESISETGFDFDEFFDMLTESGFEDLEPVLEDDELEDRKPDEEKDQENPESKEEKHEEPKLVEEPKEEPSEETDEDEPEDEEDKAEVADSEDEEDDSEDAKDTEEEEDKESSEESKEDKKESDESKVDHDEEKHDDLDKEEKEEIDDIEDTDEISDAELADDDEELELQADEVDDVGSETDTEELSGEEMDVEDDNLDLDDDDESTDDDIYDDEEIEDDDIEDDELDTEDDSVEDIDTSEGISTDSEVVQESKTLLGYRGTKKLEQKYHIPDKYCIERRDIYEMFSSNVVVQKASNAVRYIKDQDDINRYFKSLFKSLLNAIQQGAYAIKLKKSDFERYTTTRQMYQLYKQTYKGSNPIDLDKLCHDVNVRNAVIAGAAVGGMAAFAAKNNYDVEKFGKEADKRLADFATHGNGISIVNNAYTDDLTDQEYISEYCMCLEDYIDDMNLDTITEADMEVITEGINSIMNKISSIVDSCNKKIAKRRAYIKDRKQLKKETKNYDSLRKGNWYNNLNIIIKDYRKLGTYDSINKESKKIFDDLLSIFIDNYNAIADSTTSAAAMRGTLDKDKKFLEHTKEKMQKEYKDFNLSGKLDDIFGIKSEPEKEHKITNSDVADILMTGNHINDIYQAMERYIDQWESEVHKQNRGVAQRNKIRDEKVAQIEDEEQKEYIKYCIKAADMLSYIMSIEFNACDRFCGIFLQDTQDFFTEIDRYIKVINAAVDAHHAMNGVYTKK